MQSRIPLVSHITKTNTRRKVSFSSWSLYTSIIFFGCLHFILFWNNSFTAALSCYECDSSNNFTCTERWDPNDPTSLRYLNPDCRHVFEARYCVKMTGIYDGKLGTKRFCSSKDWGNYCEYIQRPGDIQEYRSCIFSCSLSGCNTATKTVAISQWTICSLTLTSLLMYF